MSLASIRRLTLHRLAIPLRGSVSHAAATRRVAEPVIVRVELGNGTIGFGETLPREYVTGESVESVLEDLSSTFTPYLLRLAPSSFFHALESIEELPHGDAFGRPMPAARAAIELALLDSYSRAFGRPLADMCGWLGIKHSGPPGSLETIRFSGVLAKDNVRGCLSILRKLRLFGLRRFKLKVGYENDEERVRMVAQRMASMLRRDGLALRLDANGAWTVEQARKHLHNWKGIPIAAVEQPLPKGAENDLAELSRSSAVPVILDESLTSMEDARRHHELGIHGGFNIRISKCGGMLPSLRLAEFAQKHGYFVQLGCMVGETSLLSAAGLRFLEIIPEVRFAEGCFGTFLLKQDVCAKSMRFGWGGRPPRLNGLGLGVTVDERRLERLALSPPKVIELG